MSDLNPYEEGLALELARAQARIDELEAKLAKAVESLEAIMSDCVGDAAKCGSKWALAELKGEKK